MVYLITFSCYGTHLHGAAEGSVDRHHNMVGSPILAPDNRCQGRDRCQLRELPYVLDEPRRAVVLAAIDEVCRFRDWHLLAAHVRTAHIHAVVDSAAKPERVMIDFKAYASRALNRAGLDNGRTRRWTRHGGTRWLWKPESVTAAIRYVVEEQGEPLTVYSAPDI